MEATADEFETIEGAGGKHLAPKRAIDYVISFLSLALISALVAAAGILGLRLVDVSVILSGVSATDDQMVVPNVELTLVDGTNSDILGPLVENLASQGWNIVSISTLSEIDPNLPLAQTTLIFIESEDQRPAADLLVKVFPGALIQLSNEFESPITVLIGTDYQD